MRGGFHILQRQSRLNCWKHVPAIASRPIVANPIHEPQRLAAEPLHGTFSNTTTASRWRRPTRFTIHVPPAESPFVPDVPPGPSTDRDRNIGGSTSATREDSGQQTKTIFALLRRPSIFLSRASLVSCRGPRLWHEARHRRFKKTSVWRARGHSSSLRPCVTAQTHFLVELRRAMTNKRLATAFIAPGSSVSTGTRYTKTLDWHWSLQQLFQELFRFPSLGYLQTAE